MNQLTNTNDPSMWFNRRAPAPFVINRRMSVRYVRRDLVATVQKIRLFSFPFLENRDLPVKLIDISSRGVLIATNVLLRKNKKILLTIRFSDLKEYEILGRIVRKSTGDIQFYGIKFNSVNDGLADHLLATQSKLTFR